MIAIIKKFINNFFNKKSEILNNNLKKNSNLIEKRSEVLNNNDSIKSGLVIDDDGTKRWYKNDVLHREDGPAIEFGGYQEEWFLNGERHRQGGPAFENIIGMKDWYEFGKRHREDGPAVDWEDGHQEWWVHGQELSEAQFNHYLEMKRLNEQLHQDLQVNNHSKIKPPKI